MQSSKKLPLRKEKEAIEIVPWAMSILGVLSLSVFGSNLRVLFKAYGLWPHLIWVSLLGLALLLGVTHGLLYFRSVKYRGWIFSILLFFLLLVVVLVENDVERLHFIIFGLFGFFSARLFQPPYALGFCVTLGAGDELLQYFLPSRVGDLRDVGFNLVAASFGLLIFYKVEK
ncbi:MAG: VanZ family protein [SAR324 cluster bacterium]|nr:VanZ family protein [SAR324 cluster bacterium]